MGKATLAHQRAIGTIGQAKAQKLLDAGLVVIFADDYARLKDRLAELEKENRTLREIADDATRTNVVAAQVLKEAMNGKH